MTDSPLLAILGIAGLSYFLFGLMTVFNQNPKTDDLEGFWQISKAITALVAIALAIDLAFAVAHWIRLLFKHVTGL